MATKTGKLTANRAKKEKFLRRDFGDLEVQMGVGDVTSPIAVLGIATLATTGGRGHGFASVGREAPVWQVSPLFLYRGDLRDRGPIGSSRWYCWRERRRGTKHARGARAGDKKGLKKG